MSEAVGIYRSLQRLARKQGRPTDELLTLYAFERFLARLAQTPSGGDFVLKGGVLLSAYRLRRPTRNIDMQAVDFPLDEAHLRALVDRVSRVDADDGISLDTERTRIDAISDEDTYSGLRVHIPATIHTARVSLVLDVSSGDPIWPKPQTVRLPGLLGDDVEMLGYTQETVIAEKAVTVLQRGTTSTRWRDFVDLGSFARQTRFRAGDIRAAALKFADHRGLPLGSLRSVTGGYAQIAQTKWRAWRSKQKVENLCHEQFSGQLDEVIEFLDPVFIGAVDEDTTWAPTTRQWA